MLVGKGHNGGDALIALRVLMDRMPGLRALVVLAAGPQSLRPLTRKALEPLDPDRDVEDRRWSGGGEAGDQLGVCLVGDPFDFCLDGLLGMSFRPPLRGGVNRQIIDCVNRNPSIRLRAAIDLPSGLGDASDAEPFRADFTYATGIVKAPVVAPEHTVLGSAVSATWISGSLPQRQAGGRYLGAQGCDPDPLRRSAVSGLGQTDLTVMSLCLTGSRPYPGALLMSVRAALQVRGRSGHGLCPGIPGRDPRPQAPEAIWVPWPETLAGSLALEGRHLLASRSGRCSSLVVGPGLGNEAETLDCWPKRIDCSTSRSSSMRTALQKRFDCRCDRPSGSRPSARS